MAVLPAEGDPPPEDVVVAAVEALRRGACVIVPTDTVYGLAASLGHPDAVAALFALKGRPEGVPIAVLVAEPGQAWDLAMRTPAAEELAGRYWPGPLTLVLGARDATGAVVGSSDGSVGVRCPDHALVRAIADRVGPLATTSANPHGGETPTSASAVAALFPAVEVVLDGGTCDGTPSTVVDARAQVPRVLRQGALVPDRARDRDTR